MNKTILVVLFLCFGSAKNFAQKRGEHEITKPYAEIDFRNGDVLQIKKAPQHVGKVQGIIGADVLLGGKAIIDYYNHCLYLRK